jgi:hypothetical protein
MNTQNILKYYGSKLDVKLDSSEYYDYDLGLVGDDFDSDVIDFNTPIDYGTGLTIDYNTTGYTNGKTTISFCEYDNSVNDPSYIYSGLTFTIDYSNFIESMGSDFEETYLNNNILEFSGFTDEIHYFEICGFNNTLDIDERFYNLRTFRLKINNNSFIKTEDGNYLYYQE